MWLLLCKSKPKHKFLSRIVLLKSEAGSLHYRLGGPCTTIDKLPKDNLLNSLLLSDQPVSNMLRAEIVSQKWSGETKASCSAGLTWQSILPSAVTWTAQRVRLYIYIQVLIKIITTTKPLLTNPTQLDLICLNLPLSAIYLTTNNPIVSLSVSSPKLRINHRV